MRNEKTSKRIASIAAKILALPATSHTGFFRVDIKSWRDIRMLAASALTQAPDKKPDQMQRALDGKLGTHDDRGFDPHDGGKIGREHVPKRGRRGVARKGQGKGRSSFYPAAKPKRSSP